MTLLAPALIGVPPVGLGLYSRGHVGEPGFAFFVGGTGADWSFAGVDAMRADPVRAAEEAIEGAIERGQSGAVLDWETPATEAQIDGVANVVRARAVRTRIGFTSFPSWGGTRRLASLTRGLMWGSPQLYYDGDTNARGWRAWQGMFGVRLIPSAAGYVSGPITTPAVARLRGDPQGYREYLRSVPRAGGVIVWPNFPLPSYMREALAERWGLLASPLLVPGAALAFLGSWPGMVAMLALVLIFAALVVGGRYAL